MDRGFAMLQNMYLRERLFRIWQILNEGENLLAYWFVP